MEKQPLGYEAHRQIQSPAIVPQVHPLVGAQDQAEHPRGKAERHDAALQIHQVDEFRLQLRRDGQQAGKGMGKDQAGRQNDHALHQGNQPAGFNEAAVMPAIAVVLVVNDQAGGGVGHACVNQAQITDQRSHQRPKPESFLVQVVPRHAHRRQRIYGGGRQQDIAGSHAMNCAFKPGHDSHFLKIAAKQTVPCFVGRAYCIRVGDGLRG